MTLWQDQFNYKTDPPSYDSFGHETAEWVDRPGNKERRANLIWARDNCDGLCRVIITKAVDVNARPRSIASCAPHDTMLMRIVDLDETTGEFRADIIRA